MKYVEKPRPKFVREESSNTPCDAHQHGLSPHYKLGDGISPDFLGLRNDKMIFTMYICIQFDIFITNVSEGLSSVINLKAYQLIKTGIYNVGVLLIACCIRVVELMQMSCYIQIPSMNIHTTQKGKDAWVYSNLTHTLGRDTLRYPIWNINFKYREIFTYAGINFSYVIKVLWKKFEKAWAVDKNSFVKTRFQIFGIQIHWL